jgi:hypothetical protein
MAKRPVSLSLAGPFYQKNRPKIVGYWPVTNSFQKGAKVFTFCMRSAYK